MRAVQPCVPVRVDAVFAEPRTTTRGSQKEPGVQLALPTTNKAALGVNIIPAKPSSLKYLL